jgi:type I restriction-modification system DNA methylase subunit
MHLRLYRSDTWTPAALWPRVQRKAVFVTAQSIFFARGQEQRLREAWVRGNYPLEALLSLPGRMFANTSIAPALLVFSKYAPARRVRMADLGEFTVRTAVGGRQGRTLDLERSLEALQLPDPFESARRLDDAHIGAIDRYVGAQDSKCVREVSFEELLNGECNLQPSRYLRPLLKLSGERVRLRELVEVIRAPVPTTNPYCVEAVEVGIPELDGWRPVSPTDSTFSKKGRLVPVRERRLQDSALMKGDIVMSIKGTVGRTALIEKSSVSSDGEGVAQKFWSLVTSGNCIAMRPRGRLVTPEYLLLYFRSKEFELQLDALLVGAVIPHVTPDALCDAVQIPIPSATESAAMQEKYQRLCDLEAQAELANRRIAEIVDSLWRPQL